MSTELISIHDPSIRQCTATVTRLENGDQDDEGWFATDKTCFYPEGGGQPSDRGYYGFDLDSPDCSAENDSQGSVRGDISEARKGADNRILHRFKGRAPEVGEQISLCLDWDFCHAVRRYHTALHVLCGVIWKEYGVKVTGSQSRGDSARMDFGFPDWQPELRDEIELKVNEAIASNAAVKIYTLPADEARRIPDLIRTDIDLLPKELTQIRIVEIVGIDMQADGGPHVLNTSEIGTLRITKVKSKGKGFRRLAVVLG
ncbi:alanyl-tRNA editing protein [bacterium]|nr:alanyl-tRNA editing protein [bacterium]